MRRYLIAFGAVLTLAAAASSAATQAPPATDIYLAPLSINAGQVSVGTPVNITNRPGYDNQPSFAPDGRSILFTSIHEDGQADIYRYDLATHAVARITSTPESEYSPTVMPGGNRFSVIRVERDSTQRLWSFALDGSDPRLVLASLKPVGYHAWIDPQTFAAFVLGSPNALVRANIRTGKVDTLARNIGRALASVNGGFSFVQLQRDSSPILRVVDASTGSIRDVFTMPDRVQDMAWATPDIALAGVGTRLMMRRVGDSTWHEVADFAHDHLAHLANISRLAVSPDAKWLAIVATPAP